MFVIFVFLRLRTVNNRQQWLMWCFRDRLKCTMKSFDAHARTLDDGRVVWTLKKKELACN